MDIRKISLHLSGKTPPYEKFSRLEFFDYLEDIFGYKLDKLEFYWKQAREFEEEFYYLVFEKLYSKSKKDKGEKSKLDKLLKELNLPSEIYKIYNGFNYEGLKEEFEILKIEKNPQEKGKLLEEFLVELFSNMSGLELFTKNLNNGDEEIDIVLRNNINKPFFQNLNSPLIILEAKNWKNKTQTKITRDFGTKIHLHKNLTKIGLFVSINGFTGEVNELLKRLGATDEILVLINGDDINKLLIEKLNPLEWLETLVMKSFK